MISGFEPWVRAPSWVCRLLLKKERQGHKEEVKWSPEMSASLCQLSTRSPWAWRLGLDFCLQSVPQIITMVSIGFEVWLKEFFCFTSGRQVCTVTISAFLHLWLTLGWPLLTSFLLKRNISSTIHLCDKSTRKQTVERPFRSRWPSLRRKSHATREEPRDGPL